jgi:hypothetical protein
VGPRHRRALDASFLIPGTVPNQARAAPPKSCAGHPGPQLSDVAPSVRTRATYWSFEIRPSSMSVGDPSGQPVGLAPTLLVGSARGDWKARAPAAGLKEDPVAKSFHDVLGMTTVRIRRLQRRGGSALRLAGHDEAAMPMCSRWVTSPLSVSA